MSSIVWYYKGNSSVLGKNLLFPTEIHTVKLWYHVGKMRTTVAIFGAVLTVMTSQVPDNIL